jgi:hypothetical protein
MKKEKDKPGALFIPAGIILGMGFVLFAVTELLRARK